MAKAFLDQKTYIGFLLGVRALKNVPKHVNGGIRLDRNSCQQPVVVDISDQLLGACLLIGRLFGGFCG